MTTWGAKAEKVQSCAQASSNGWLRGGRGRHPSRCVAKPAVCSWPRDPLGQYLLPPVRS